MSNRVNNVLLRSRLFPPSSSSKDSSQGQFGFPPAWGSSRAGWLEGSRGPSLATSANINTEIPPQLETLNALDSVHYKGPASAINAAWAPTGFLGWLGWLKGLRFQFKAGRWKSDWAGWTHHGNINNRVREGGAR